MLVDLVKYILGVVMTYAQENQANTCEVVFLHKSKLYFWLKSDLLKEILNMKKGEPIPVNQFSDLVTSTCKTSNFLEDIQHILSSDFFKKSIPKDEKLFL